jgi:hypothetical protein
LISGLAYIGQKNSWAKRSSELFSSGNPTGTQLGFTQLRDSLNYISSYPDSKIAGNTFSSAPNSKCRNLKAVKKRLEAAAVCFEAEGNLCQYTHEDGDLKDYCGENPRYCTDMICVKEKAFDDDYYREMAFPTSETSNAYPESLMWEEPILEEPIGFHGFYSEGANASAFAYLGVKLKQATENPIVKLFTSWTTESLTGFFNRVVPPVTVVPPISLSIYISDGPAHEKPGFPDKWMSGRQPCGEVSTLVPYPDHDGSAEPAVCVGKGDHIYLFNNTVDPVSKRFFMIVAQVDVVGTIQFDRPDIPHPPRVVEYLTQATVSARIAANTMTLSQTCPAANLASVTKVACEPVEEAPRCIWRQNICTHRNPDHHGTVGSGDFRYSVGENSILYPDPNGFKAPGWTGSECTTIADEALCNAEPGCFYDVTVSTNRCRVQQAGSFQKIWGSDLNGQYLNPVGHDGDMSGQKVPSGKTGTWKTIYYYKDFQDDDEQKLDPRWTFEKSIDPRFAQYFESGDFSYYINQDQALEDRPP